MAGRPTLYKKEYDEQAFKLTLLGFTDSQLAKFFDIQESTLNLWKGKHPTFMESLKKGKDIADAEVVMSLRRKALGYRTKEITIDSDGSVTEKDKEVAPDTTAQIYWLNNRQPQYWRNKVQVVSDRKLDELLEKQEIEIKENKWNSQENS